LHAITALGDRRIDPDSAERWERSSARFATWLTAWRQLPVDDY
jgi:hypothetical protein